MEVSVVYFRAGFEAHEYEDMGHLARFQLERSRAIKCPSVLSHLTTLKKVQQALAMPGALDRFLSPDEASAISRTFVPLYPLDKSPLGKKARNIALDENQAKDYVLKPSLEGGGHNIYGTKITDFLEETPQEMWPQYILMRKIVPPALKNFLMSPQGLYEGPVISELGIFGVSLWKRTGKKGTEIIHEQEPSWSFKTKNASVDEMSVVKGYGCFGSPALVDDETFAACVV
jgi:glutathione synthase